MDETRFRTTFAAVVSRLNTLTIADRERYFDLVMRRKAQTATAITRIESGDAEAQSRLERLAQRVEEARRAARGE